MSGFFKYTCTVLVPVFVLALASLFLGGCTQEQAPSAVSEGIEPSQAALQTENIPVEIVSISDSHPGDDITVSIKTKPGAEVNILFTSPSGSKSAYPKDNIKVAGDDGIIIWKWNINSHVPSGEAILTFTPTGGTPDSILVVKKKI